MEKKFRDIRATTTGFRQKLSHNWYTYCVQLITVLVPPCRRMSACIAAPERVNYKNITPEPDDFNSSCSVFQIFLRTRSQFLSRASITSRTGQQATLSPTKCRNFSSPCYLCKFDDKIVSGFPTETPRRRPSTKNHAHKLSKGGSAIRFIKKNL